MCEGDEFQQVVDASFVYIGGKNGSCTDIEGRNLHIAKLGISCPSTTYISSNGGGSVIGGTREYVFDDAYFECNFNGSSSASASAFDSAEGTSDIDVYTCLTGGNCNESACTDIQFTDIIINSFIPESLNSSCVESLSSVRFEALWANLYDSGVALTKC